MNNKKRKMPSAIVLISFLTVLMLLGCYLYIKYIENQYAKETEDILKAEINQMVSSVDKKINIQFKNLQYIAGYVSENEEDFDCQKAVEKLKIVKTGNEFYKVAIADLEGNAYFLDGTVEDISDEKFFKDTIENGRTMSDTIVDDSNELMNIYSIRVDKNEEAVGVIYAFDYADEIINEMKISNSVLDGKGLIMDKDGIVQIDTLFMEQFIAGSSVYSYFKEEGMDDIPDKIKDAISIHSQDCIKASSDDIDYIIYGEPLEINDWYLISILTPDDVSESRIKTLFGSNLFIAGLLVVYLITIIVIIVIQEMNKRNIERIAYIDELTGGKSFTKFKLEAEKLVKSSSEQYAIVDIDVDRFKFINDIFGYEEGNNVIRFIWKEIDKMMEKGETFAHYSADQFVLLLKIKDMDSLTERLEDLALRTSGRKMSKEKNYDIVLSMGIYKINKDNSRIDTAIDRATLTKKSIKGKHHKLYAIYDEKMRQKILRDQEIENMMENALNKEEFKVFYQPKYDSISCELTGAEALVRWYNEKEGMIYPNEFIPVFENNGFITELDKYMFEHVCADIKKWLEEGYDVVPVSVNLSQLQLYNTNFIQEYKDIVEKYEIPPEYVQLELTETTLFSKVATLNSIIDNLHSIGFKILMDDFGTGYSSLNMLKNVKVDILKLDKSFVDDIGESKGNVVVSTIVSLGQLLDMKIIAEGVETKEQFEFLRDIFCDEIQGYYFSKPIPEDEYKKLMNKGGSL